MALTELTKNNSIDLTLKRFHFSPQMIRKLKSFVKRKLPVTFMLCLPSQNNEFTGSLT